MIIFYAPDIEQTLTLPESDSQHCVRVLRMHEGDELRVIDGRGTMYHCRLSVAHAKRARVEIMEREAMPLPWDVEITVAVAPTKHMDRMEWMVEKLTEIGVNRIVPVCCGRSERREIKRERLEKIAVSAMKQSLKAVLPEICEMTRVEEVLDGYGDAERFIAYCDRATERVELACGYRPGSRRVVVLIGPEGDFTPAEVARALDRGWRAVTLGENRLRTETAAIAACHTIHVAETMARCSN